MPKKIDRVETDSVVKRDLGQHFTRNDVWLQPQIRRFILRYINLGVVDPYAGEGDLLNVAKKLGTPEIVGYDIDQKLCDKFGWTNNDGLLNVPPSSHLVITNPPWLAKNSAKRLDSPSYKYFNNNKYTDLYQISLDKILATHDYVVAIIPETYWLSGLFRERLKSITILEDNPFLDTEIPTCVACFEPTETTNVDIYKNSTFIGYLSDLIDLKLSVKNTVPMLFNDRDGNIGLRGVDNPGINGQMCFQTRDEFIKQYPIEKIINTSRAVTLITLPLPSGITEQQVVDEANKILKNYRTSTHDIFLCPFKGNKLDGTRRRRLDYKTARAIIEKTVEILCTPEEIKAMDLKGKKANQG